MITETMGAVAGKDRILRNIPNLDVTLVASSCLEIQFWRDQAARSARRAGLAGKLKKAVIYSRFGSPRPDMTDGERESYAAAAHDWFSINPVEEAYSGSRTQRAALRGLSSAIIHNAVVGTSLTASRIVKNPTSKVEVRILKELTWHYVIENPRFATEQFGKKKIIQTLFDVFSDAAVTRKRWTMFPVAYREQLQERSVTSGRCVADYITSLGEQRAVELASELGGLHLVPVTTGVAL